MHQDKISRGNGKTAPVDVSPVLPAPVETHLTVGHGAVLKAIEKNTVTVIVPALGSVQLPSPDTLAWLGGLTALAVIGLVEWPIAVAVGAGHVLAQQRHL